MTRPLTSRKRWGQGGPENDSECGKRKGTSLPLTHARIRNGERSSEIHRKGKDVKEKVYAPPRVSHKPGERNELKKKVSLRLGSSFQGHLRSGEKKGVSRGGGVSALRGIIGMKKGKKDVENATIPSSPPGEQ